MSATVLCGSAMACGGNSTNFTPSSGGSSGKGGSGTTGGDAGEEASGGKGGSSASGGTGGSTSTGGAGGKGGGTSTGGSGGSSGSTGTGGSAAGTGGSAGMGGMRGYHPPESQVDGCTNLCQKEAAAMCENEDPLDKCISDCRVAILFEDCSAEWDAVFECSEDAEFTCDDSGEATASGCIGPYAAALACVFGDALDTDFQEPCADFCAAESAPACENEDSEADCTEGCVVIASAFPVCQDALTAQLACGADAEFSCNDEGQAEAAACIGETLSFLSCVVNEYDIEP